MKKYPFKFLDAYGPEDAAFFFGRNEETEALYEMLFQSSVLLVYGASGTGKTSLIQCGLASRFPSHDWLPLTVRRGSNLNDALKKALADAGGNSAAAGEDMDWLAEVMEDTAVATRNLSPLARSLKAVYRTSFRPIYLIFDQFEELFILGSPGEEKQFIEAVKDLLQAGQPVKLIFSIREEYLGNLNHFERAVPQLLRKKLRVEPMTLEKVQQVIGGATSQDDSNIRLKEGEAAAFAEGLFDKIRGSEKTLTVQLPYLQVFLDKLYLRLTGDESRQAEAVFSTQALKEMGDIGDVLRDFLEEQVAVISKKLSAVHSDVSVETVWGLLSPFATLKGTKEPMDRSALHDRFPALPAQAVDDALKAFINGRLLNYGERDGLYELAHDALAKRIADKRSDEEIALVEIRGLLKNQTALKESARELFSEKQLKFMEPFLDKIKLTGEEESLIAQSAKEVRRQKRLRRNERKEKEGRLLERQQLLEKTQKAQRRLILFIGLALLIVLGLAVWALQQKGAATKNAERAEAAAAQTSVALEVIKKEQALSAAKAFKNFGDSYRDLGSTENACESYSRGLDTLRNYAGDSLYNELRSLQKALQCK